MFFNDMRRFYPQPRSHAGVLTSFFKTPLKLLRVVCISGNITFLVLLGHLNISSPVACFLHDLPTEVSWAFSLRSKIVNCLYNESSPTELNVARD